MGVKIFQFSDGDQGSGYGMEKIRIRDPEKHPGSATLAISLRIEKKKIYIYVQVVMGNKDHIGRLLQLLLGVAINCSGQAEHIQHIMAMEAGLEKTRFFFKNPAQCVFFFFFCFFLFFGVFWFFYIFAQKRKFLGFFQLQEYF